MNGGITVHQYYTVHVWTITDWTIGTCLFGFRKVNNSFHLILKESKNVQLQYINVWFGLVHKSYKPASIDFCLGLKYYDTRIFLPLKRFILQSINLNNPERTVRQKKNVQIDRKYNKWIWNFVCNQNGCWDGHHRGLHRSVCTGHCNSMPENELINDYSIRGK